MTTKTMNTFEIQGNVFFLQLNCLLCSSATSLNIRLRVTFFIITHQMASHTDYSNITAFANYTTVPILSTKP